MDKFSKVSNSKCHNKYSEEFKRSICQLYADSNCTINSIETKSKIGKGRLVKWLDKYGYEVKRVYLVTQPGMKQPENKEQEKPQDITDEVAKLKAQLECARFEAEAFRKMIEVAERELKINIRKKSATKQ